MATSMGSTATITTGMGREGCVEVESTRGRGAAAATMREIQQTGRREIPIEEREMHRLGVYGGVWPWE
jgi:hypothetical protein